MAKSPSKALTVLSQIFVLGVLTFLVGCSSNKPVQQNKSYAFWPPYPDEPRLQYLTSYDRSEDVAPQKSKLDELIYGKEAKQILPIAKPYGVGMWNGRIYVCDIRNNCVTIFDLRNRKTLIMGKTGAETLLTPTAIAISPDGMKYVSDIGRDAIFVFDAQDRYVGRFGQPGLKPAAIALFGNEVYVSDFTTQQVLVFDRTTGSVARTIGEPVKQDSTTQAPDESPEEQITDSDQEGTPPPVLGRFAKPLGLAVDQEGNVYVMDMFQCILQKFDRQGKVVSAFGGISGGAGGVGQPGLFVRPKHIAVDSEGIIYVVDSAFQNVQLFNNQGKVLTAFGGAGTHPGAMFLPVGVCVHDGDLDLFKDYIHPDFEAQRLVIVTSQFGANKVSVYALGRLKPGKTAKDLAFTQGIVPSGGGNAGTSIARPTTAPTTQPAAPAGPPAPTGTGGRSAG